jgi:hypothetical protein
MFKRTKHLDSDMDPGTQSECGSMEIRNNFKSFTWRLLAGKVENLHSVPALSPRARQALAHPSFSRQESCFVPRQLFCHAV